MTSFIEHLLYSLVLTGLLVSVTTAFWMKKATSDLSSISTSTVIAIGDSHIQDLSWEGRPSLTSPSNGILLQYLALKRLTSNPDSMRIQGKLFVLSMHPGVFTEKAELRLMNSDPTWTKGKTGEIAALFRFDDLSDCNIPDELKAPLLCGMLQQSTLPVRWSNNCSQGESINVDYFSEWWVELFTVDHLPQKSPYTVNLFEKINSMVEGTNNHILWLENPMFLGLREQILPKWRAGYDQVISAGIKSPNIHYLNLSGLSDGAEGFKDGDHFHCEIAEQVDDSLQPVIDSILYQILPSINALQLL